MNKAQPDKIISLKQKDIEYLLFFGIRYPKNEATTSFTICVDINKDYFACFNLQI